MRTHRCKRLIASLAHVYVPKHADVQRPLKVPQHVDAPKHAECGDTSLNEARKVLRLPASTKHAEVPQDAGARRGAEAFSLI